MLDGFGQHDPRKMPIHLFSGALDLDYDAAVRADISRQNRSICPRHWYINATFRCARCGGAFIFTAREQQFWYEELGFWIDSLAKDCGKCRRELREITALQREYDRDVAIVLSRDTSPDRKQRLIDVVDSLVCSGVKLPEKVHESRRILKLQVDRLRHSGTV